MFFQKNNIRWNLSACHLPYEIFSVRTSFSCWHFRWKLMLLMWTRTRWGADVFPMIPGRAFMSGRWRPPHEGWPLSGWGSRFGWADTTQGTDALRRLKDMATVLWVWPGESSSRSIFWWRPWYFLEVVFLASFCWSSMQQTAKLSKSRAWQLNVSNIHMIVPIARNQGLVRAKGLGSPAKPRW